MQRSVVLNRLTAVTACLLLGSSSFAALAQQKAGETGKSGASGFATTITQSTAAKGSPKKPVSGWRAQCSDTADGTFSCAMSQTLIDGKSRRPIIRMVVNKSPVAKEKASGQAPEVMWFQVTHGIYLPAGVVIAIDEDKPVRTAFVRSDQGGLYAPLPLTPERLKKLRDGKTMKLQIALNNKRAMSLNAPLRGFTKAYERIAQVK